MRLLLVIWSLELGGAQKVMMTLANRWAKEHEVTLMTLDPRAHDQFYVTDQVDRVAYRPTGHGVRVLEGDEGEARVGATALPLLAPLREMRMMLQIRRLAGRMGPDAAIGFMATTNNRLLASLSGTGVPAVVCERTDPRHHGEGWWTRIFRRVLYRRAASVVVLTETLRPWANQVAGGASKVRVIPNMVTDVSRQDATRGPILTGVGRLVESKGFDVLLDAFARIADRHPAWRLRIAGDGVERQALEALAEARGVADRVDFLGVVDDVPSLLQTSEIFVLGSRYEGFPNALLEAMSHEVACVATDCPSGPSEIVQDGENGLLVPVDDVHALADSLDRLMADEALRRRLGRAAGEVRVRYSLDKVGEMWDEVLRDVTAR